MSQFVTLVPTAEPAWTAEQAVEEEPAIVIPTWMQWAQCILTCAPLVFLLLFWAKRLKCDKVISYTVCTCVTSFVLFFVWLFGSGNYQKLQQEYQR